MKEIIGFWGFPHPDTINKYKKLYPDAQFVDLDVDYNAKESQILPKAYCKIVKNLVDNALAFKPKVILAAVGKEKCDSGFFCAKVLRDIGFEVIETRFEQSDLKKEIKISTSNLPLRKKTELITASIVEPYLENPAQCKPKFGFWGVPPNDLSILELFPDETHLFGWIRCIEANAPADIELEMYVQPELPTVFYSQAFCAKMQLAKYLADKHNGLFLDIDDYATNSVKAKIEAFLRLR